jgi:hypothetical protein
MSSINQSRARPEKSGRRPLQVHGHRRPTNLDVTTGQRKRARAELYATLALSRVIAVMFTAPRAEAALAEVEAC